ncbi:MAG TPA: YdcF family protein [Candidatus Sulfopaludibacter sp.]|nr:YdcF family protein [Candidatus Sulfopaludibacter sp.]
MALVLLAAVLYLARPLWLRALGHALVYADGPAKADIAVVLAGDYTGHRIDRAADLVRKSYVPVVLVDGPHDFFGANESTLAIRYEVGKGNPAAWFIDFPIQATSTEAEANLVVPELQRRNIHSYLLVTSDFHSARAARIFRAAQRKLGYDAAMRVVVSHGRDFGPDNWWQSREGKKAAFLEWCKTIATALGE